jgi:SAM-dependent methyltransferase
MGNLLKNRPEHSAQHFGDARDHWWNGDSLGLLGRRWGLDHADVRAILDVGCGVGHWSRLLAGLVPPHARFVGIDREPGWAREATARATAAGLAPRSAFCVGAAESLPFPDGVFDLVTCQTLLIHVRDPAVVLAEMVRVTRPGGLVVAAEPTNAASPLIDAVALGQTPGDAAALVSLLLTCQRGKRALGRGDDLIGESLPGLFARASLRDIEVRQNDRPASLVPPYASPAERATVDEELDADAGARPVWDEATTRSYWLAGGGEEARFASLWEIALAQRRAVAAGLRAETFTRAGGTLFYVVCGRRGATPSP